MSSYTSSPGDLGRRIAHRRQSLGLSREELGERAGMVPGYIQYIEENPASVTDGALLRLAAALGTTASELLGGGMDHPPGHATAAAKPSLQELEPDECMRLISPGGIGRVAFNIAEGPLVLPVNYKIHEGAIVFRTAEGGPMDHDLRTGLKDVEFKIAFEVDRIDEVARQGWSVLVLGPAHHITADERASVVGSGVEPWAGGERELYVRITPRQITGRRIAGF